MATPAALIRASGLPQLEARVLAAHALGVERVWVTAHENDELDAPAVTAIDALYARRRAGEPVAYLTGEREFFGLSFAVSPAVLIPRPETELLVEHALSMLRDGQRVLDLGTGSGAIAVAIATQRPDVEVVACDESEAALAVAGANTARHRAQVRLLRSDWFGALRGERFDMVVSNPPYIAAGDAHLAKGDLRFEPRGALVAGPEGMECIESIATLARGHLLSGGVLLLEHGHDQGGKCVALLQRLGYREVKDHCDLAGVARLVQGRF